MSYPNDTISMSAIRSALSRLPADVSHSMWEAPDPQEIYAPPDHEGALDPSRALVVGGRGMGKSFWAGAYVSPEARKTLQRAYPSLQLDRVFGEEGFTGGEGGYAPSQRVLDDLTRRHFDPYDIWRAVVLRAVRRVRGLDDGDLNWRGIVAATAENPEAGEQELVQADNWLLSKQKRLTIVFDALDRLGTEWNSIRERAKALLRTALALRSYKAIGVKLFIRPDQYDDVELFYFPDASKLRAAAVRLRWEPRDLYGLLFMRLLRDPESAPVFREMSRLKEEESDLPLRLREDPAEQERIFIRFAGQYMGVDRRRGRVYTWLTNHLADAHGEVSPRSFLTALKATAEHRPEPMRTAIDPAGIRAGVVQASAVRLDQLAEDYSWIQTALDPLASQRVPCPEKDFIDQWKQASVIKSILASTKESRRLPPVELEEAPRDRKEAALVEALVRLGVLERRNDQRINMPDIFRVAARLLRKGGVRPSGR
jgi:hypothetical protein